MRWAVEHRPEHWKNHEWDTLLTQVSHWFSTRLRAKKDRTMIERKISTRAAVLSKIKLSFLQVLARCKASSTSSREW
ncbi:hypothetical protein VTN96DRAFT_4841 [Rasamsonia emersonii]